MHRHAEEVLYLLCFRSEGSSANHCSGSEGKISKSELCIGTAPALPFLLCVKSRDNLYCVFLKLSRAKYGQSSSWRAIDMPNLERELMFGAKPRARAHVWSQTSSRSSCLEPNIVPELLFGAKPRAEAHSGSAERSMLCTVLSKAQLRKMHCIYKVFARLKAQSSKVGLFHFGIFRLEVLAQPTF